ncbi:hypothetical protein [Fusobacterium nucleatum]|uniref:Uncharacterized protein n=1 Tax=Fusobacterium nucleatum TaxID=851 RepID=A0A133P0R0_FUSNU|nr:hypothetical protein [Fusobacterium nucleatum]KXA22106.1 hypothetical protein HMPREF3221_00986 [Fusobacterium nucleatum]
MGILKDVFNGKKGMTGIVSEEQEKKFQEQRKKNMEKGFSVADTPLVQGIERNISNPIRTGLIKGVTQIADFIAEPMPEFVDGKYTDDYDKNYEEYKKQREKVGWKGSELRKTAIETIKKNREERAKFLNSNSKIDKGITIFQSILEGAASPTNWYNPNGFVANLAWDILQGAIDTTWEKTEIEGKEIKDFGKEDLKEYAYGAATSVAIHGVTKVAGKYVSKKINKLKNSDVDIPENVVVNAVKETPKTPLEVIQNEVDKYGPGATNPKAVIELAERLENGETVGIERGKNFSQEVDDFYTNVTEKRIEKIHKEELSRQNTIKNKESNAEFEERIFNGEVPEKKVANDINAKDSLSKTLKPIKNKIKLNSEQLTAEYKSKLAYIHMENGGSANFSRIGDLNELIITENNINGKTFKGMIRGYADVPENLIPYANEFRNIADEYTNLKYGNNLSQKGYNFDIVYDKNQAMSNLKLAIDTDDLNAKKVVVDGILKNTEKKVYLTEAQAKQFKVGDTAGVYILDDHNIIEKLRNDINGTTLDIRRNGNGKLVDYESKTWKDVAVQNAPLPEIDDYFKLKQKEIDGKKLSKKNLEFIENYEQKSMNWLDGFLDDINAEVEPVNSLNRIYKQVIDEKSGLNILRDRLNGNYDRIEANHNTSTGKNMYVQNNRTLKYAIENETQHLFELGADVSTRKFSDMSSGYRGTYNTRNLMMYKFLSNLNYLKEIATNKERINSGLIDLGFNERVSFLQSTKEMTRATKNVTKKYQNLKNIDLDTITNPLERLQIEAYIDKVMETEIDMRGYSKSNFLKNAGELGAKGQTASDVQRIALAEYFTANAMYDEFTKFKIEDVTPTMKQVLFDMGIDNNIKLKAIQDEILNTNSVTGLLDIVKDRNNTSNVKSLFEQFADINGKELNAFSGHTVGLKADSFVSRTWVNFNGMFRMYNMNLLTRTFDRLTTYIDSDGFTRYRFLVDNSPTLNKASFTGLRSWKANSRIFNSGTTALETAGIVYGIGWLTGKITGTSRDEMIEAKMDALMHGEVADTVIDVIKTGLVDNTGLEITMGGENVVASFFNQTFKGLKRDVSSNLSFVGKIIYGAMYIASPLAISRGIDNIKFEKNIPNRLDTASEYLKEKWKYEYKEKAQAEQDKGLLPVEKLGLAGLGLLYESGKKAFDSVLKEKTDYQEYFEKHPEQAERFGEFKEDTPQEAKIALASGIMELAEYGARNEQLDEILSTADTVEEREKELKEYGMDYQTQLTKMDKNNKLVFHAVMSYAEIESPETIILAMNEFNELKTKEEREAFLSNFIREDQVDDFNNFLDRVMEDKNKKLDDIYDRDYSYGTEGYIEFLQTLRNEM